MMAILISFTIFSLLGSLSGVNLMFYLIFVFVMSLIIVLKWISEFMVFDGLFIYDSVSIILVILSVWVSLLMIFSSYKIYRFGESSSLFSFFVVFLLFVLALTFFSGSYLLFYFFFEVSLIPTLLIIMGWGYQPERLQAGIYFLFYTLTASLPLLVLIIFLSFNLGSLYFLYGDLLFFNYLGVSMNLFIGLMGAMAFLVSLPMYFTHLWLPKAHVEAPVAGSMILAGVLLKLGGYGLIRLFSVTGAYILSAGSYFIGLSLVGMVYVGFMCCRVNDFKALVAYSSVAHMGMVICGVVTLYSWGYMGGLLMMIGHGLSSSGLFCIVNMYYERTSSRSFYINKGLMLGFPIFSMMMFLLCAANIAAPPTVNLLSEIFLMISIMGYDYLMFLVFPLGSFLGAVFTLFMFSFSQHGAAYYLLYGFNFSSFREIHILLIHIIPVNFMVLNFSLFFSL